MELAPTRRNAGGVFQVGAKEIGLSVVLERASTYSVLDVLDRVLDKGIVIDGWWRVLLAGLDLVHVEARIVVASIDTYLTRADILEMTSAVSPSILIEPRLTSNPRPVRRRPPPGGNRVA